MILTNRLFTRNTPSREAKSIYIFCEGAKREVQYFEYFKEIDSRINIEVYPLRHNEDNSPLGLYAIAYDSIVKSPDNQNPKYEFLENDEVWFVIDSDKDKLDTRKPQITELRQKCHLHKWNVAQSNPCFEVWLHNHLFNNIPVLDEMDKCISWKQYVNKRIGSGFDSRRHPIFINDAISNSIESFSKTNGVPDVGCTEVYSLGISIYTLVKMQIENIRIGNSL